VARFSFPCADRLQLDWKDNAIFQEKHEYSLSPVAVGLHIMTQLLIVYHSMTGGSRQMAEAAFSSACDETTTIIKTAKDAGPEDLLQADGYIFCAPENLAAIAGMMKDFYDRCYYPVLGRIEGNPYAQMVCAGSDGQNAARQTARIAQGWRLKEVQPPLIICTHAQTPEEILAEKVIPEEQLALCRNLGAAMGAGLSLGVF
jgi:NAD(P)H-dependent FMN reductase